MINKPKTEISRRYLSEDERVRITDLHERGLTVRSIAAELGRGPAAPPSTPDRHPGSQPDARRHPLTHDAAS